MKKNYTALNNSMVTTFKNELNPQLGFDAQPVAITGTIHSKFTKILLLIAVVFFSYFGVSAQTTLISPTGAGGFELAVPTGTAATDYTANGWTLAQGTNNRMWIGSTAVSSAGSYSAFSGTTAASFTGEAFANVNHFYRDITFPAGETKITLAFKHKIVNPDIGGASDWDNLKVFLVSTSTTPIAGTALSAGSIIGAAKYESATTYAAGTVSFNIPASAAGTTQRLVFSWKTDGASPHAAISVDEISLTSALPSNITSNAVTGNWSSVTTWVGGVVPSGGDNVTIVNGSAITIDAAAGNPTVGTLIVGGGASGTLVYNATAAQTLTVGGNLTVNAGASLATGSGTVTTHILDVSGNITNNGTINLSTNTNQAAATLRFSGSGDSSYSGAGATNNLWILLMNKASLATVVDLNLSNFQVRSLATNATGALLTSGTGVGTLKFSGTNTFSGTLFSTTSYTIPSTLGIWLNNPNFIINGQSGSPTMSGLLRMTAGTYNVGTAAGNSMSGATTSSFVIEGGIMNFVSRLNITSSLASFNMSGGTINMSTLVAGNTSSATATFGFTSTTSVFTMSGGTINMVNASTGATQQDWSVLTTTPTITGGTVNFGTAATGTKFSFTAQGAMPNVVINNDTNAKTVTISAASSAFVNTTINSGTILNLNGFTYTQRGATFTNNGILTGTTTSSRLSFFAATAQTLSGSGTVLTNIDGLSVQNGAGLSITHANQIPTLRVNLFQGTITGSGKITMGTGAAATVTTQVGSAGFPNAGGSFDVSPTYNLGTGLYNIQYLQENGNRSTGFEVPPSRAVNAITYTNPTGSLTVSGGNLSTGTLTFGAGTGNINTSAANVLTITGTTTGSIVRTSTTSFVNGPLQLTLPANLTGSTTYSFPIGKAQLNALDIVNVTTGAVGPVIRAEVFDTDAGGVAGLNMGALNTNRHWASSVVSGDYTTSLIRLNGSSILSNSAIAASTTKTGTYDIVGGSSPTIVVGTSITSVAPLASSLPGFFVIGTKAVDMSYVSSTTTQTVTSNILKPTISNQQIIGMQVVTLGNANPLSLTSFNFDTAGSTNPMIDIAAAKVYYTGLSNVFATTTQFGTTLPNPDGAFTINGSQNLGEGTNYFWLVYDLTSGAVVNNVVDAQCTSLTVGTANTPTVTNPAGSRTIKQSLSGTYLVGASASFPNFTKLTDAITDLNSFGASGAVVFELQGDYTSAAETFPLAINAFPGNSSVNTLTIKPKSGVTAAISGSSATGIIVINGGDYVTIDGSNGTITNTVCPLSVATRDLTITNTNASTSSAVVWLQTATADGAANNTVKNCALVGSGVTQTLFGLGSGSSTIGSSSLGTGNNNNTFENNTISGVQYGVYTQGASIANKNTGNKINQNIFTASANAKGGIWAGFENNITVSGNRISNIAQSSSPDTFGISLGLGATYGTTTFTGNEVTNATVTNNNVSSVVNTGTFSAVGIGIASASSGTSLVANNAVYGVNSNGTSGDFGAGIMVNGGAGSTVNVYSNSVNMTGGTAAATTTTGGNYAIAIGGSTAGTATNIVNNIFVNSTTTNMNAYAIGIAYSTFTGLTIANNNYFTPTGATFILGRTGSLASGTNVTTLPIIPGGTGSIITNPNFNTATDLALQLGSPAIGVGLFGTGITTDITCANRTNPPSMGAYDAAVDILGPTITFTLLTNNCAAGARTLTATITDISGVPTSGAGLPVLYWRIGAGAYTASTGVFVSGNTYNFSLGTGSTSGQTVSYYIVAQDNVGIANTSVFPIAGAAGFTSSPPAVSTPPTTPSSYLNSLNLSGNYTVGSGGAYATLTAAVAAYNTACISGAVTFSLTDASYAAETFPITINANATASAINTLTIKPAVGVDPTVTGSSAVAILRINAADFVTIDGSNNGTTSKNLTLENTNIGTSSAVLWINSIIGDGATNNTVKNTIAKGNGQATTLAAIMVSGSTIGTAAETANTNTIITNTTTIKAQYGIGVVGVVGGGTGLVVTNNTIGSSTVADYIGFRGIFVANQNGANVSNNVVQNIITTSTNPTGIFITTGVTNSTFNANKIDGIRYTGTGGYGGKGIDIATGNASSSVTISNSMVSNIGGDGWSSLSGDSIVGIRIGATTGGINLYNNTVNLQGSFAGSTSGTRSAALYVPSTATSINLRNNILVSSLDNTATSSDLTFAIYSDATNTAYTAINYNNYFVSGAAGTLGFIGSNRTNLADIQAGFGQNTNSSVISPNFVSATDLHLNVGINLALDNFGTPIAGITTDIDGDTRSVTTPDMGADEFTTVFCGTANGGTAALAATSLCASGTTTLSATGYSIGDGTTYEWEKSTDDFVTAVSMGAPSAIYAAISTGVVSQTTKYRLKVICSAGTPAYSAPVTLTVFAPTTITASATPNVICSGASISLAAAGAVSYTWSSTPAGYSATGASNTVSPAVTTTYNVIGLDNNNCPTNTTQNVVTVNQTPSALTIAPVTSPICNGTLVTLSATGGTITPTTQVILIENFNSGIGTFSTVNSSSTTAQNWTAKANSYFYDDGLDFYTFSGSVSGFMLANSDVGGLGGTTNTQLISPAFDTNGFTNITLQFREHLLNPTDLQAAIEVSSDNFATFTVLRNQLSGTIGSLSTFASSSLTIPAQFLNQSNVKIRFRYEGSYDYWWAIDEVVVSSLIAPTVNLLWSATSGTLFLDTNNTPYTGQSVNTVYARPSENATYAVTATSGACSSTANTSVVVNQLPAFTAATPVTICQGNTATLTATSLNGESNSFTWYLNSDLTTDIGTGASFSPSPNPTAAAVYAVRAVSNSTSCVSNFSVVNLNVNNPGAITQNPIDATVATGGSTTFTVAGTVSPAPVPYNYQWQRRISVTPTEQWGNLTNDYVAASGPTPASGNFSGVTTAVLTVRRAGFDTALDNERFRCVLTPNYTPAAMPACANLTSTAAKLTVSTTGVTANPADITICLPAPTNPGPQFSITTNGQEPSSVDWEISTNGGSVFNPIALFTLNEDTEELEYAGPVTVSGLTFSHPLVGSTYDFKVILVDGITSTASNNFKFRAIVNTTITTTVATLNVSSQITIAAMDDLSEAPTNVCKVSSTTTNLKIVTSGTVGTITWRYATSANGTYTNLVANTPVGVTYSITNPSTNDYRLAVTTSATTPVGSYFYKAFLTGVGTCPNTESKVATITVNQPAVAIAAPITAYCTPGAAVALTASGATTYSWTSTPAGFTASGATQNVMPTANTTYIVEGTDAFGCKATAQQAITVGAAFTVTTANATALSCPGTALALTSTINNPSTADQYLITTGTNSRNYAFTAQSGSFTPLVEAASSSVSATADDSMSSTITPGSGFTFNYGGTDYTNFRVSSNGQLVFGTAGSQTATNNLSTTTTTQRPGLAPLWDDLQCTVGIKYLVEGTAPNRILTVEWLNMLWNYTSATPVISFQVKLYETTNVIEYVYRQEATPYVGTTSFSTTDGASIGLMGTTSSNFISLQNSSANPTISTTVSTNNIETKPATGQVYRFTPSIAPVYTYAWTSTPAGFTSAVANPSVTPTVATSYNLTVMTPSGCNATAAPLAVNMFTTAPTITTQPIARTICTGQAASFSVAATNAVTVTYQWRRNGTNLTNGSGVSGATSNSLSLTTAAALVGNYDVLVSSCTNLTTTSEAVALTINALPTVSVSPSTATFCAPDGDAVVLTASGAATYTWLPITELSSAVGAVVNASPSVARIYTVTGTGANGCTATASTSIAIVQKPQAVTANASLAVICVGGSSNLTSTSTTIAQGVSNYSFASTSGVYSPITGGTVLATSTWDNTPTGIAIPLGFSFSFNGATYTTCNINLNGFISFGTTTTSSTYTPISTLVTGEVGTISAFGRDLQGLATTGEVRYLSTGGEFIVQWSNARRYSSSTNTENINFQIRLNQVTGQIRFVYGAFTDAGTNTNTTLPQVGLRGTSTADFKNIEVLSTGNWNAPTPGTLNTSTAYYNQATAAVKPGTGLTYTFTPPSLSYAWSGPNGFTAATQNTSISNATLAASGVYTVTATNGVCSTTAQTTVTVTAAPNAGTISGTQAVCSNGTTQLTTTGTGGTWSSNATGIATVNATTGLVSGMSAGSATITYTVIGTGGCSNATATRMVTVTNATTWYADADNDTYGNPAVTQQSCSQPSGYVSNNTDCNDGVFAINPGVTEICWNNIDDNCNNIKSEGCAPIPVYVNNPTPISGLGVGTISNFATHLSAVPYTYPGATSLDYRFEITNTSVTPNQTVEFTQTGTFARYFTIPVALRGFNTTYTIRASAVINGEEVPYVVPVITVRSTGIPTVKLSPTSCGATLSRLNATISANPGFNASSYEFRIRLTSDTAPSPMYYYVQSLSRFIGANSFIGLSLQYNTSYSVSVRYATASVGDGVAAVISGYGEECIIMTPTIPLIGLSSPVCGSRLDRLGATISASPATYAQQYQFRVRLTSDNAPMPNYYTTTPSASRYSSLMAVQGLVLANDTQYSVSVRYSIPVVGSVIPVWSDYGSECILITPIAAVARIQATPFSVVGYPNPFAEGFQLNVKTTSASSVSISVYDMIGRLIETRSSKASAVESITIGERYPSGVYNVVVTQDDEVATVRMIKR